MTPAQLLRELIRRPSVNPALLPPGDPRAGEARVAGFLATLGRAAGLRVTRQPVAPGRANLLLTLPAAGRPRQRVLLAPHLDTVGAEPRQLHPVLRRGRLHGRGACDTKGSVAAMFCALAAVARAPRRPAQTEIVLAALADEEDAQRGSRALVASGFTADLAIVGEPTGLRVVTVHKGSLWLRLETRGRAAHGARPELGRNAVLAMARIVTLLETEYAAALRARPHPLLGPATVNVGVIAGGVQPNIVPDRCEIHVDRRTLPGESLAGVQREIRALLRLHHCRATISSLKTVPCPPLETDPDLPLVRRFLDARGQRAPAGADYFCDAAVLSAGGIPSVVFGPGDIAQAHTADEWIALDQLARATDLLTRFLAALP
jgi:acetylornithine deacetylase/succinyl-diaminopimelate desuccinylase-like protein